MVRSEEDLGPPWLRPLLGTSFFVPCPAHPDLSKNECNLFCLGCADAAGALCSYCVPAHRDHHVVQVHSNPNLSILLHAVRFLTGGAPWCRYGGRRTTT
jgi:hypothetical protein